MKRAKLTCLTLLSILFSVNIINAQCDPISGKDVLGRPCGGTLQTAVPFLRINPDARSGAMGDVGIGISPDANAMHFNASKLAMADQKFGGSLSYTPWLHNLGVNDIYLAYLSGFYQFGSGNVKQAVGLSLRYFSLGEIQWTDYNATPLGTGSPREFELAASYSRQLSENFSVGITGKYFYSNLATGQSPDGGTGSDKIHSGQGGAADISMTYKQPLSLNGGKGDYMIGVAISNIGGKVNYFKTSDFLPTNLGIGGAINYPFDQFNRIVFALDLNKYLVPTPQPLTTDPTGSWRTISPIAGIFKSFTDAPGGFGEELQSISISTGAEYWYDNQFAFRAGYFYEDKSKGGRQYLTVGLGLKYSVVGINLSYLVPTSSQRGPLDNTLRFSLLFDAASFKDGSVDNSNN